MLWTVINCLFSKLSSVLTEAADCKISSMLVRLPSGVNAGMPDALLFAGRLTFSVDTVMLSIASGGVLLPFSFEA